LLYYYISMLVISVFDLTTPIYTPKYKMLMCYCLMKLIRLLWEYR